MVRASKRTGLQAVPEDEAVEGAPEGAPEVLALIDDLERNVEEKIRSIMVAASDAVFQLKKEFATSLMKMPKKVRDMPLSEFKEQYPDDFNSGALALIGQKFATMKQELVAKPAAAGRGGRTAAKRAAEPETVLRTTRRRVAPQAQPAVPVEQGPEEAGNEAAAPPEAGRWGRAKTANSAASALPLGGMKSSFNGRPLQTPMPFAGEVLQAAVTLLTQKRGGRTRGVQTTEAAVITTADGQQWAVGKEGLAGIPATHRQEVQELLTAQFEFFAAALGKTVMTRRR